MLPDIGLKYYRFGSKDSIDIDMLVEHPNASGEEKDIQLIDAIHQLNSCTKNWNINVIEIEDGAVTKSIPSKGSPDGVNNSLYETYHLHDQFHPFPLSKKIQRDINKAIEKCFVAIFTFYKKTNQEDFYNTIPKRVKNGSANLEERLQWLKRIDFGLKPFDDEARNRDAYKRIAFHIGQTISLIEGIEIYTKEELIQHHPHLIKVINREVIDEYNLLNEDIKKLILKLNELPS